MPTLEFLPARQTLTRTRQTTEQMEVTAQFQGALVVAPTLGPDAASGIVSKITLDLTVGSTQLVSETVSPTVSVTEPNGVGCGTCTNASSMASFSGG